MNNFKTRLYKNWGTITLIVILAISFFLNYFLIGNVGTSNEYYAACIKSMTQSWHNFFFISFDPAGMVSVDKSPLGLMIEALFCKIFGYSGYVMMLPQAISGTLSAFTIYVIGKRYMNKTIGLLSAFIFSLTPVVVVLTRNNTMDMHLILLLLISVYFVLKSLKTQKWRFLILAGVFVGLGFNVKMLQAYLILPAVAAVYIIFSKQKMWKRFAAGILSCLVMVAVSGVWVAAVALTPAENRPYVDSTQNNSIIELIFNHNGSERLFGQSGGGGGGGMGAPNNPGNGNPPSGFDGGNSDAFSQNKLDGDQQNLQSDNNNSAQKPTPDNIEDNKPDDNLPPTPPSGNGNSASNPPNAQGNRNPGGMDNDIGNASIFRLWNKGLFGQADWLLLFAVVSFCVLIKKKGVLKKDITQSALMLFGIWLISVGLFFSFAGFYHPYYLAMIVPPISVLSAAGFYEIYKGIKDKPQQKSDRVKFYSLLLGLALNVIISAVYLIINYGHIAVWAVPTVIILFLAGLVPILVKGKNLKIKLKNPVKHKKKLAVMSTCFLVASSLLASSYFTVYTVFNPPQNATIPTVDPKSSFGRQNNLETGEVNDRLLDYLISNYKEGSFLITASRSNDVAQYIIKTGLPCYAYGGFLGNNTFTVDKLKELVDQGKITYFLIDNHDNMKGGKTNGADNQTNETDDENNRSFGSDGNTDEPDKNDEITSYVEQNATKIDSDLFGGSSQIVLYKF